MLLVEILNSEMKYEVAVNDRSEILLKYKIGEDVLSFMAYHDESMEEDGIWEISFMSRSSGFDLTNKGNEFKIFSMVKILIDILMKKKPTKIFFSAKKGDGRANLYKKLANRLPGFSLKINPDPQTDESEEFVLVKD